MAITTSPKKLLLLLRDVNVRHSLTNFTISTCLLNPVTFGKKGFFQTRIFLLRLEAGENSGAGNCITSLLS